MLRPLIIVGDMIKFPESPRSHKFWQLDMSELVNVKRERERASMRACACAYVCTLRTSILSENMCIIECSVQ